MRRMTCIIGQRCLRCLVGLSPQSRTELFGYLCQLCLATHQRSETLIVWLIGKERSAFVDREAKEALNFSILISIIYVVCTVTSFLIIPLLIMLAAWIASIVFCIQGAMAANKGQDFRYPFNWRIIK